MELNALGREPYQEAFVVLLPGFLAVGLVVWLRFFLGRCGHEQPQLRIGVG
jgi:hypothetical protein